MAEVASLGAILRFLRRYAVAVMVLLLMAALSLLSDSFLTTQNLMNILNQNAPLAIVASAMTLVIICGGFDLSVGNAFSVAACSAAWVALHINPYLGLAIAPFVGLALGVLNGVIITSLRLHSFLATLATGLMFRGLAILITGGKLIPVRLPEFTWLGRGKIGPIYIAVIVMLVFAALLMVLLNRTTFGRRVLAVGGNEEAAILSGIRVNRIKIAAFAMTGLAAGLASAISVSRVSMGQPAAGAGLELDSIAAVIIGGTSIYGGRGAIWRSVAGVLMLALINNGFNILNADPFFKDFTTGFIIVVAVAVSAIGK